MNNRELILNLIHRKNSHTTPAAFFMHFDPAYHRGRAAVKKHSEFFRATGMDLLKIQYENPQPAAEAVRNPRDWTRAPLYASEFFDSPVELARGLVQAIRSKALVIMTLYSPFMWAGHYGGQETLARHLQEDPQPVIKGLEIMTENVLQLVRGCKKAGVDGFYVSTQGGEAFRFRDPQIFSKYVKPTDLAIWEEIRFCRFNILHICDYEGSYSDLAPFLEYPGDVVNSPLQVGDHILSPMEMEHQFARPFMGGMQRKGIISTGSRQQIRQTVKEILAQAPEQFILGADCTVPSETPWENLKAAVDAAHEGRQ